MTRRCPTWWPAGAAMGLDEGTVAALQQLIDSGTSTVGEIQTTAENMTASIEGLKKEQVRSGAV